MAAVFLEVVASAAALRLTNGTVDCAVAVAADFTLLAYRSTGSTVFTVIAGVDADIVAVGLAFGAFGLNALAFVTVVLTWAVQDLCAKLKTSSGVFHAGLVLTGNLRGLGRTFKGSFFALIVGTIWNTLTFFAFLKVAADSPPVALGPNTTCARLSAFYAGVAACRQAALGFSWRALHALVVHTDIFVTVGAVFVLKALHTAAGSIAFFSGGAILVGSTYTPVLRCTFLGGAGVSLAVNVFQARDAFALGRRIVEQTAVRAILTAWNRNSDFTSAAERYKDPQGTKACYHSKCVLKPHDFPSMFWV